VLQLLVTADIVPSSPILSTMMMYAVRSSETSALTRATGRHIPEHGIVYVNNMTETLPSNDAERNNAEAV
jgi:hypothetical protein